MGSLSLFSLGFIGVGISFFYFFRRDREIKKYKTIKEEYLKKLENVDISNKQNLSILLTDYNTSNKEIERRENITLVIGTIMLTSSFLMVNEAIKNGINDFTVYYGILSIGIYTIWLLILHDTTRKIDNLSYPRIRAIEEQINSHIKYGFGVHSFLFSKLYEKDPIELSFFLRKIFWGITLLFLSLIWIFLSFLNL